MVTQVLSNVLTSFRAVDRGNPVCYLYPVIHETFGRAKFELLSSAPSINCRLDVFSFRLGSGRKRGAFRISIPKMGSVARNSQVVRTGFLQPQNFAWNSGPDPKRFKK